PVTTSCDPLSLHDALPIFAVAAALEALVGVAQTVLDRLETGAAVAARAGYDDAVPQHDRRSTDAAARSARAVVLHGDVGQRRRPDRKSTRLNSSHVKISYA